MFINTVAAVSVARGSVWVAVLIKIVVAVSVFVSLGKLKVEVKEIVSGYVDTTVLAGNVISLVDICVNVEVPAASEVVTV